MSRATVIAGITKAISQIDISRLARRVGDLGCAEAALDKAQSLLTGLISTEAEPEAKFGSYVQPYRCNVPMCGDSGLCTNCQKLSAK